MDTRLGNQERMNLYSEALTKFGEAKQLPELFRDIFKRAFLPYRSPEVLGLFLKEIAYFDYVHSEELGNAYEYLLSIMGSQGDAGQFRTPRHIIDFIVEVVEPSKGDRILDPACGTAGFLISAYKHILAKHDGKNSDGTKNDEKPLTASDKVKLTQNFEGYEIDPGMARISQVNMYLHQFKNPKIYNYDTLSQEERWSEKYDVILANPPFMSPKGGIKPHSKFSIPSSRSEVLFVDYIIDHLRPKGRAGIIVPEGIIFQSGSAHTALRKKLVDDGLYAVVSLPSGVFQPYSGVKTSILFFDNEITSRDKRLLFVDIKTVGFSLGASLRPIEQNDLVPALEVLTNFRTEKDFPDSQLAFVVSKEEVAGNGYNLSQSQYRKRTNTQLIKYVSLNDVCSIQKGKSSSTKTIEGPYKLYLTAEESKTADHYDFEGEGVCVPLISATGHGRASVKRLHYVNGKFALANLLAFLEPKDKSQLSARYLFWILDGAKDNLASLMRGAANVSMKVGDLEGFQIPLPPLEVQEQIVAELDGYQNIITGAEQIVENWKPKIDIDPSWEKVKLGEQVEILNGYAFKSNLYANTGIRVIRITNVQKGGIVDDNPKFYPTSMQSEIQPYMLNDGDLLMSLTGNVGRVGLLPQSLMPAALNQRVACLRIRSERLDMRFLYWMLNRDEFEQNCIASSNGMAQKNMSTVWLSNYEFPLPPLDIQKQIVEKIETERALVESSKKLIDLYEQKKRDVIAKLWSE
jgi:type I restriction enzyme M protein